MKADFASGAMEVREQWNGIFKALKDDDHHNHPSKTKKNVRHPQIDKYGENVSLADMPCKKY